MEIILYDLFVKRINSTKRPDSSTQGESVEVTLKQATNLMNPVFVLTMNLSAKNYVYVPSWGRYYFISDVVYDSNNLCELHCTFDPLATYRDSIGAYTGFVERTSSPQYYNTDINDNALSVEDVVEYSSSANTYCRIANGLIYIVRIVGRGSTNGIGTFVMNRYALQHLFSGLWGDIDSGSVEGSILDFLQLYIANPSQYIEGVYASPLGISVYSHNISTETVYVGGHETNLQLDRINEGDVIVAQDLVLNKPSSLYNDFRKTDGSFSQYSIYIPTIGNCPLSADIMDTELTMDISADLYSGDLLFILKSDGVQVSSYSSNCYSPVAMGTANIASSVISGAMQGVTSVLTANPLGAIESVKTAFSQSPSVIGTQGGTGCTALANEIVISCLQKRSAEFPTAVYGRPCFKNILISRLLGHFVKCGNASIDNIAGTDTDKNMVNDLLNAGFYYE